LTAFPVSWSYTLSAGFLGRGMSPSQGLYLHTKQHRIKAHNTDTHALSGIQPTIPASELVKTVHTLDRAATVTG
jgi:hypothetical protein